MMHGRFEVACGTSAFVVRVHILRTYTGYDVLSFAARLQFLETEFVEEPYEYYVNRECGVQTS